MQITRLLFPTILTVFLVFSSILSADNNSINGSCPGEIIQEMDGANVSTTWVENGGIGGGGNDRYRMTFPVAGTLSINLTNRTASRNANYDFYVSNTTCGNWNVINGAYGNSHSTTVTVNAGDTIWVRMQSLRFEPGNGRHNYALSLAFTATPASIGCDNSLDTTANSSSPYTVIPQMHNITASVSTCISGSSTDSDSSNKEDNYYFTVNIAGTLSINTSSPNNHPYHLRIGNSAGGSQYYGDNTAQSHNISTINLSAGDTVYLFFQETGSDEDHYEMNLNFSTTSKYPPTMGNIPNQVATVGSSYSLDISTYVSEPDGDSITYNLTCLPNGLSFNTTTGIFSGAPITVGSYSCNASASDSDGISNIDNFTLTVSAQPLQAIDDNYNIFLDTNLTDNLLNNDTGTNITYIVNSATSPSNGTLIMNTDGSFTYTPNSSYTGTDTFDYSITDSNGGTDTARVTIRVNPRSSESFRDFSLRYQKSLPGDILTIGNTVLVAPINNTMANCNTYTNSAYISDAPAANDTYNLCAYWDDNSATFPTTTAQLILPTGPYRIEWAGLYWQALVPSNDSQAPANDTNMKIKIKHGTDTSYTTIGYDQLDWNHALFDGNGAPIHDSYSAFKDVTKLFVDNNWGSGNITVGDIPVSEGQVNSLGTYGAWTLVIVYNDKTQSIKNFSIYDGWKQVDASNPSVDISISGFKTPRSAPIKASTSVFTAEGDKWIANDSLEVLPSKKSTRTTLSYVSGQTFNSSIKVPVNFSRAPNPVNNQGIDIQEFDLGTSGYDIIEPEESKIDFRFKSNQDRYWPSMISFSAELLIPKLCYDYVVQKDNYTINAKDRNISSFGTGDLDIGIAIRSLEGDFDLENTSLELTLDSTAGLTFDNAFYSPNTVNILIPAINVPNANPNPNIAIGENATSSGGIIGRFQRYFTRFDYTQNSNTYNGHFELDINTSIDFGSGPVEYHYSSADNTIEQCPISSTYAPQWLQFNIERTNSNPNTADEIRYPLYTQIVGRDFDLSIVSYDATAGLKPYTVPKPIKDITVDVELIDAKPFGDQSFKCNNTFQSIVQPLPNGRQSFFVRFPSVATSRVDLTSTTDMITTTALENAAFRVWLLVDGNNTIIEHTCAQPTTANPNDACFIAQVSPKLQDPANSCPDSNCSAYISPRGERGCYACYRDFFAKPICSRDNFSIRPESYSLTIIDDNENNSSTKINRLTNNTTLPTPFAAEYNYRFDGNATRFQTNINALQYNIDVNASLIFNDSPTCFDTNDTNSTYILKNGIIVNNNRYDTRADLEHNNVGDYLLRMIDRLWTKVDQRGFINEDGNDSKTFPQVDDCIRNSSITSINGNTLSGCDVASNLDATHTDMALTFEPYKFDISQVQLNLLPNPAATYLFMNDFSDPYYNSNDINMSARFAGLIQAKGKKNLTLTNFTNTCHANDKNITLIINRTTAPIDEANLTSTDKYGQKVKDVFFQQKLTMNNVPDILISGPDANVSLSGLEFDPSQSGTNAGEALIVLDTTFKKPSVKHAVVNPFDVNYSDINATSLNASSFANQTFHTPEGNNTYNRSLIYYFAKVTPQEELYGPEESSSIDTPISVDIYCIPDDGNSSICSSRFNLTTPSHGIDEQAGWYAATMFTPLELGTVDLEIKTVFGNDALPKVNDNTGSSDNVNFDDLDATQADINVSLGGPARPSTVDITVRQPPYLRYDRNDINGYMHYRVRFIGNSTWSGVGNTGHAVETTSNKNTNPRMNW